jgi:dephospho-CoA kinase
MKMTIGITGGIASGKSFVCKELKQMGYPLVDCDQINKDLQQIGMTIYNEIVNQFGLEYINEDKTINRTKLGKLIFENKEERIKLNNISHPLIIKEMRRRIDEFDGLVFVEIPLLFETKLEYLCDKIICVFVDEKTQINRLMARDGIEYEYTLNKIKSQMPLENKVKKSDFVIDSSLGFEDTKRQINEMINILKEAI